MYFAYANASAIGQVRKHSCYHPRCAEIDQVFSVLLNQENRLCIGTGMNARGDQIMSKRRGKGEGAIYQRESDGKWCATVDLGFVNGKRRRKVIYGETRKDVADKL